MSSDHQKSPSVMSLMGAKEASNEHKPAKRYRLVRPHGWVDENGRRHHYHAGDVVSDPHETELLQERGAPLELVK